MPPSFHRRRSNVRPAGFRPALGKPLVNPQVVRRLALFRQLAARAVAKRASAPRQTPAHVPTPPSNNRFFSVNRKSLPVVQQRLRPTPFRLLSRPVIRNTFSNRPVVSSPVSRPNRPLFKQPPRVQTRPRPKVPIVVRKEMRPRIAPVFSFPRRVIRPEERVEKPAKSPARLAPIIHFSPARTRIVLRRSRVERHPLASASQSLTRSVRSISSAKKAIHRAASTGAIPISLGKRLVRAKKNFEEHSRPPREANVQRKVVGLEPLSQQPVLSHKSSSSFHAPRLRAFGMAEQPRGGKGEEPRPPADEGFFGRVFGGGKGERKPPAPKDPEMVRILAKYGVTPESLHFSSFAKTTPKSWEEGDEIMKTMRRDYYFPFNDFEPLQQALLIAGAKEIQKIAQASKENAPYVLEYSLPKAIEAMGNRFNVDMLKEMTLIAQSTKENARYVLEYSLPKAIEAMGNRFNVDMLKEMTLIAQSTKENARYVLGNSLPKAIEAMGNRFNVEKLREFGAWVEGLPPALLAGVSSLSAFESEDVLAIIAQSAKMRSRLEHFRGVGFAENTPTDKFVVRALTGVDDPDNGFDDSRQSFNTRWNRWSGETNPPAMIARDASFRMKAAAGVTVPTLISGKKLDVNTLQSIYRRTVPPTGNLEVSILQELSKLSGVTFEESFSEKKRDDFVIQSLRAVGTRSDEFTRAVMMALPLLPRVTGMSLPGLSSDPNVAEARAFLDASKVFFDVHLPEVLQSYDVKPGAVQTAKERFPINSINSELGKFAKGKATQEQTIELKATKTVLDAFYDALGQNCICRYGFELDRPDFQPIRLVDPKTNEHFGVVYALSGVVNGVPSMIVAGIEPKKRFAYAVNSGQFMKGRLDNLEKIAKLNGLTGGVYSNVGKNGADDGRVAQYDVTRNAIQRESKGYLELARKEQIQFPKEFNQPIKYLWRLR